MAQSRSENKSSKDLSGEFNTCIIRAIQKMRRGELPYFNKTTKREAISLVRRARERN